MNRNEVVALGRIALVLETSALAASLILGLLHAVLTGSRYVESFSLMSFLVFLVLLGFAVLSGPGMFLSRPRLAPIEEEKRKKYRGLFVGEPGKPNPEFFELALYTGLAMLFLLSATGIARILS